MEVFPSYSTIKGGIPRELNEAMAYLRETYGEEEVLNELTYHYSDFLYSLNYLLNKRLEK